MLETPISRASTVLEVLEIYSPIQQLTPLEEKVQQLEARIEELESIVSKN